MNKVGGNTVVVVAVGAVLVGGTGCSVVGCAVGVESAAVVGNDVAVAGAELIVWDWAVAGVVAVAGGEVTGGDSVVLPHPLTKKSAMNVLETKNFDRFIRRVLNELLVVWCTKIKCNLTINERYVTLFWCLDCKGRIIKGV